MFTIAFWKAAGERAVKSFAQSLLAVLGVAGLSVLDVNWQTALGTAGLTALLSVLASIGSSKVGGPGPSLGAETIGPEPEHRAEAGQVNLWTVLICLLIAVVVVVLFLLTPLNWGHG